MQRYVIDIRTTVDYKTVTMYNVTCNNVLQNILNNSLFSISKI